MKWLQCSGKMLLNVSNASKLLILLYQCQCGSYFILQLSSYLSPLYFYPCVFENLNFYVSDKNNLLRQHYTSICQLQIFCVELNEGELVSLKMLTKSREYI